MDSGAQAWNTLSERGRALTPGERGSGFSQCTDGNSAVWPVGKDSMAFKPNYNQQRAERTRAKQAKQDAKRREKEEAVARRKSSPDGGETDSGETGAPAGDVPAGAVTGSEPTPG